MAKRKRSKRAPQVGDRVRCETLWYDGSTMPTEGIVLEVLADQLVVQLPEKGKSIVPSTHGYRIIHKADVWEIVDDDQ